jgi:hypothetical protein
LRSATRAERGCRRAPAERSVAFCEFDVPTGGTRDEAFAGHAWSGGSDQNGGGSFAIPETASASELGWAFFKELAW